MIQPAQPRNVGILIFPDVEILDFCGPFEVFASATLPAQTDGGPETRLFEVFTIAERARARRLPRRSPRAAQSHARRSSATRPRGDSRRLWHPARAGESGHPRLDRAAAPDRRLDHERLHRGIPARGGWSAGRSARHDALDDDRRVAHASPRRPRSWPTRASSTRARSSPPPGSPPASTWRSTSSAAYTATRSPAHRRTWSTTG